MTPPDAPNGTPRGPRAGPGPIAAPVDPARAVPGFDPRHLHADLTRVGTLLLGTADAAVLDAIRAWAAGEGLEAAVEPVAPRPAVTIRAARLRGAPAPSASAVTEVRLGEAVEVVAEDGSWRRVRTGPDRYLGWIRAERLTRHAPTPTHAVVLPRSHAYAAPRVQGEVLARLAWGDRLHVRAEGDAFHEVRLPDGRSAFVPAPALAPSDAVPRVAPLDGWRELLEAPYLWGGGSAWGLDCSGFVQLLFRRAGRELPRDADEQYAVGQAVTAPRPGDLACFRGHIGLALGEDRMAHASGRAMRVVATPTLTGPDDEARFLGYVRYDLP